MDVIDYIENCTPSENAFLNAKNTLKQNMASKDPTIDLSDNSVFGDLVVNRFCKVFAVANEAQECIMSDIIINNLKNDIICDCKLAEAFVNSLGLLSI